MKLFLQKNAKYSSAGGFAPKPPDPQNSSPHCEFLLRAWMCIDTPIASGIQFSKLDSTDIDLLNGADVQACASSLWC